MKSNVYLYIAIMTLCTYAVRALPLTLIRKEITNRTLRSFLFYVPYVTLAVMTFPAILDATQAPTAGLLALFVGVFLAWRGCGLFLVSALCCLTVFLSEFVML